MASLTSLPCFLEPDFRLLFEATPIPYLVLTPDLTIVAANEARLHATMTQREQILGRKLFDVFPDNPDDPEASGVKNLCASLTRVMQTKTPDAMPIQKYDVRRNGSGESAFEVRYWKPLNIPVLDPSGELVYIIHQVEDVTVQILKQQAIEESEARFRQIANAMPQIVWSTLRDGYHDYFNQQWYDFTGVPEGSTNGKEWRKMIHPDDLAHAWEVWRHSLATGEPYETEYRILHRSGEYRWVLSRALPICNEAGEIERWMGTCTDIHAQKLAEAARIKTESKLRKIVASDIIGIFEYRLDGTLTEVNDQFLKMIGYTRQEFERHGLTWHALTPPEWEQADRYAREEFQSLGKMKPYEKEYVRKDGSRLSVWVGATSLEESKDEGVAYVLDISELKKAQLAAQESELRFRSTFEHAPLGIAEWTIDGRFITANPKLFDILGYTREEFAGFSIMDVTHPSDVAEKFSNLQKLIAGEADTYVMEKRYLRKDRSFVWVNVTTSIMRVGGKPQYFVAIIEDITVRKKAEEEVRIALERSYHLANHDALTGLANRANFNDHLKDALRYAQRDSHLVAVHFLDLDRFKSVNDTLGHHIGDLLLKEVARRIKSHIRATDLVARFGGDEFVIIQTHLTAPTSAEVLAEKIVEEVGRPYLVEGHEVRSGTSIGIAIYPNNAEDPEQLLKCADLALYEAKNRGRHNYQMYREGMGAAVQELQRIEQELRRALREGEFTLHYQPQFDLKSRRITGVETLIRWRHPEKGLLAASEFIHDAENVNLIVPIGEWALRTACRQYKEWVDAGFAVPLTLNISSKQLRHFHFLEILKKTLEETKLSPSSLQLEIRESALWDPRFSASLLKEIKNNGLLLALDAFGNELTALSSLHRFPLDVVKPSKELVKELPSRKREAAVMAAIIGVAHDLNIAVCAEGVETADQLAAVKAQGCDSAQGNLLSLPLETDEMERLIEMELAH